MSKQLYESNLGEGRIGKKGMISYERNKLPIEIDVIAVDHQIMCGQHEYKVEPIGEGIRMKGWFRNVKWYRPDEAINYEN